MPKMTVSWNETSLPTILTKYELNDIYNAGEFGLFYQAIPDKSLHYKGECCISRKHSKVRLTGLPTGNAMRQNLPMFVIRKSAKPRCFSGVKGLPCRYCAQKYSWMDGDLFIKWVKEKDMKFATHERKIALIITPKS